MNGSIRIEHAKRDELYEIAAFLNACWQMEYSQIVALDFLGDMSVKERHEKLLIRFDEDASGFLAMRDAERMIGAAVFGKSFTEGYPDDGEISAIYLHHDYIGKGYGHTLFTKIEQILTGNGYTDFILDVLSENKRAVNFYIAHGYKKVADRYVRLGEKEYPLTVFRKVST